MSATGGSPFYESPWFWGYTFSAAVLAGLLLFGDRIVARQNQLENQYFARQEQGQSVVPPGEREVLQESEDPLISMGPFYAIAGLGFIVCWGMFLYERIYANSPASGPAAPPGESVSVPSEKGPEAPA